NGPTLSDLLSASTSITNTSSKTKTLTIWLTQNDYTAPTALLSVESGLGGSVSKGGLTLTDIFQAYGDKTNTLFGTGYPDGPQTAIKTGSPFATGSRRGLFTGTANHPSSLTSVITFTLSGGGKANFSSHVNVTSVTPAPAGLVLLAGGAAALALARLRRRK